jgi:Concanavalin A-like lectin/glucanases superfamily/Bacterial TSP3 repeat
MKKSLGGNLLAAISLFSITLLTDASAQAITKNSIVNMGGGTHRVVWDGVAGRTFFVQWSTDLMKWKYYPVIKNGTGSFFHQDAPTDAQGDPQRRFFFRLRHTDLPTNNAETADFDNDGLGNLVEVATQLTDPFNADTDGDGLTDGWEVANGMDPNDNGSVNAKNGPNGDLDGDGLTNLQEKNAGTNPNNFDSDFDGIADNVDTTPLANNAAANPDGENLPVGIATGLIARFDYESVRTTPATNGAATSYADLSGNNWHAGIFNAGITPAGGGMPSKAALHNTGHTLLSQNVIKNKTAYSISTWVKLNKDAIKNLPNTTVQMGLWGHHRYQNINNATSISLNGLYVHKKNATQEEWFLGSYLYSATSTNPLNGLFFTQPLGTSDNGEWLHVATTRNGNTIQLYLNGVLKASGSFAPLALTYDANTFFSIGRLYGSAPPAISYPTSWQGNIDRTLIHGRALNATEIAALRNQDADRDGLPDWWETKYGLPATINSRSTSDFDDDELSDIQEFQLGTDPNNFDTDGDTLPDGFEVINGLNPLVGSASPTIDTDNDGVTDFNEWLNGTNPLVVDTDGDTVGDGTEIGQGSNPTNSGDGGQAPPADEIKNIPFSIGGDYANWRMQIRGLGPDDTRTQSIATPTPGANETKTIKLRKNNRYEVKMIWRSSKKELLPDKWYCWIAKADNKPTQTTYSGTTRNTEAKYFVIGDHWLVDNQTGVFSSEVHSKDTNLINNKIAYLNPVDLDIVHPATGELAETKEDIGNGGYIGIRRTDTTPVTKLKLKKMNSSDPAIKYRLKFTGADRYQICSDESLGSPIASESTEFEVNTDTTLYFKGLKKSISLGGEKIRLQLKIDNVWTDTDEITCTVVEAEFDVLVKSFIPYDWVKIPSPIHPFDVAKGDNRDYDILLTKSFRTQQVAIMIPYKDFSFSIIKIYQGIRFEAGQAGETRHYNWPTSLSNPGSFLPLTLPAHSGTQLNGSPGYLTAAALADDDTSFFIGGNYLKAKGTASSQSMHVDDGVRSDTQVTARFYGGAAEPIVIGAAEINWDYNISIKIDNPLEPRYVISGAHDGFPAHEIYFKTKTNPTTGIITKGYQWKPPLNRGVESLIGGPDEPVTPTPEGIIE